MAMVNTPFSNASTFVSIHNSLSPRILLHRSIRQGCPLALDLYVLTIDALGSLLEVARLQGQLRGISLPDGFEMVHSHFAYDSILSVRADQDSVDGTLTCLDLFCAASGAVVS